MVTQVAAEVTIRPLGEGGAELGMTRAEMLEHLDVITVAGQSAMDSSIQFLFAWLVAMFFIAHRLSKVQFVAAIGFYLVMSFLKYAELVSIFRAQDSWAAYAGLVIQEHEPGTEPTLFNQIVQAALSGHSLTLVFWAVVAASIWWAVSCRTNQPNVIGSPI